MRRAIFVTGVLFVSACKTFSFGGGASTIEIRSEPSGAQVRVEGYGDCETPCTVALNAPRMVTVSKAGFKTQRLEITPTKKRVDIALELVAPTTGVETDSLPALE